MQFNCLSKDRHYLVCVGACISPRIVTKSCLRQWTVPGMVMGARKSQSVQRWVKGSIPDRKETFLYSTASRQTPVPTQPPLKLETGLFPRGSSGRGEAELTTRLHPTTLTLYVIHGRVSVLPL